MQLGPYESVESRHGDDTVEDTRIGLSAVSTDDFTIPDPKLPAPPRIEFCDLPMLEQAAYTIPILQSIIDDRYQPAKTLNDEFLKGGRRREALTKQAPPKGELTRHEYEELGQIVMTWALRRAAESTDSSASFGINDPRRSESDAHPHLPMPHADQEAPSLPNGVSENSMSTTTEKHNEAAAVQPGHGDIISTTTLSSQVCGSKMRLKRHRPD